MSTQAASDAGPDAEPSPQPSPIESLPLELLGRITLLALDPTAGTKHSPENTTTLRSLALISRAWYHSAVRELVVSPRITSPSQLRVFLDLVDRLGVGGCAKEIFIDGETLPRQKLVEDLFEDGMVGVDRQALEQQYRDEWTTAAAPRWSSDKTYECLMNRLAQICPRVAALRLSCMVLPEGVLYGVGSLPLESIWIDTSYLSKEPFQHLPSTLRALHLNDIPVVISRFLELSQFPCSSLRHLSCRNLVSSARPTPRTTPNVSVLDTITSLVLDTYSATITALQLEYFPELNHLEIGDAEGSAMLYTRRRCSRVLEQLHRLPKLKLLTLPDTASWRESWQEILDGGDRDYEGLDVVWKPVT